MRLREIEGFDGAFCVSAEAYVPGAPYTKSPTTSAIHNFKMPLERKGESGWHYKDTAITEWAAALREALPHARIALDSIVCPMFTSKAKEDPLYDDRLEQLAARYAQGSTVRVCSLLETTNSYARSRNGDRVEGTTLRDNTRVAEVSLPASCERIILLDDVITTGTHYDVARELLRARFPNIKKIRGVFLARTKRET